MLQVHEVSIQNPFDISAMMLVEKRVSWQTESKKQHFDIIIIGFVLQFALSISFTLCDSFIPMKAVHARTLTTEQIIGLDSIYCHCTEYRYTCNEMYLTHP